VPSRRAANSLRNLVLLPLALMAAAAAHAASGSAIGLFTSLPIQWREAGSIREHLAPSEPHWAMAVLQSHGPVRPIDSFMGGRKSAALKDLKLLVMAQPRPLAPQENVALDAWLRKGGSLLLFADPMLTGDSRFSPGDPRRPQDIAMLSPILAHWGLGMDFDEDQTPGEREVSVAGAPIPVNLPGRIVLNAGNRNCTILSDGVAANCAIGRGRVLLVADAALLEDAEGGDAVRPRALERLIALLTS